MESLGGQITVRYLFHCLKYTLVLRDTAMSEEIPVESSPVPEPLIAEEPSEVTPMLFIVVPVLLALGSIVFYFLSVKPSKKKKRHVEIDETLATNSVSLKDINYLARKLGPQSTHMDVFMAVASCPDSIKYGLRGFEAKERIREERIAQDEEESKSAKSVLSPSKNLFDLDDEGWAEDDDEVDDEAKQKAALAKAADEQKKKDQEDLKKATGKIKLLLEGIDEGVIGQQWVESTLVSNGAWPPKDLCFLKNELFDYNGKSLSALDHPGLRRNLCMIMGRINSLMLNTHPELCK